jgi:transposase
MKSQGKPYSTDLREKVLAAMDQNGWTHKEVAEFFGIGEASVDRWSSLRLHTGGVAPRPHGGGQPPKVLAEHDAVLARLLKEKNDRTLAELRRELAAQTGLTVADGAICRALKRLNLTLKKRRSLRRSATAKT